MSILNMPSVPEDDDDGGSTALDAALELITSTKELAYLDARIAGMRATPAARIAGYADAEHKGYFLARKPRIRAVLNAHKQQLRDKVMVTHEQITQMILDALPMVESATEQVQVAMALNKHMGYEQERTLRIKAEVEKSIHISGSVDINTMHTLNEQQLLELAGIADGNVPWIEGESEVVDGH